MNNIGKKGIRAFLQLLIVMMIVSGCTTNTKVLIQANQVNLDKEINNIKKHLKTGFTDILLYKLDISTNPDGTVSTITWQLFSENNLITVNGFNGNYDIVYNDETNISFAHTVPVETTIRIIQAYELSNIFREEAIVTFVLSVKSLPESKSIYPNFRAVYIIQGEEVKKEDIESNELYLHGLYTFDNTATGREYIFKIY